jgi:hypothetical protein
VWILKRKLKIHFYKLDEQRRNDEEGVQWRENIAVSRDYINMEEK